MSHDRGEVARIAQLITTGAKLRAAYEPVLEQVFRYILPMLPGFSDNELSGGTRMEYAQDSRPLTGAVETASRVMNGLMPAMSPWFEYRAAVGTSEREITQRSKKLREGQQMVFHMLQESNFSQAALPFALNLCASTGVLLIDPKPEGGIGFTAVPMSRCLLLPGPFHSISGVVIGPYQETEKTLHGKFGNKVAVPAWAERGQGVAVYEIIERDYSDISQEVWKRSWYAMKSDRSFTLQNATGLEGATLLHQTMESGVGSCPFVTGRWLLTGLNPWGVGPFLMVMPDSRGLNMALDLIFTNAEKAITGVYQYEADSVNPHNIRLASGEMIAKEPGTEGLTALEQPARFDIAQFVVQEQREAISDGMYNVDLGPLAQTPRSATEVAERASKAEQIALPLAGLIAGTAIPTAKRCTRIAVNDGLLDKEFLTQQVRMTSPLARAMQHREAGDMVQMFEILSAFLPHEVWLPKIKEGKVVDKLAALFMQSSEMIATDEEVEERLNRLAQAEEQSGVQAAI